MRMGLGLSSGLRKGLVVAAGLAVCGVVLFAQQFGDLTVRKVLIDSDGTVGGAAPVIQSGTATPEGAVTGSVGDIFIRTDGGTNTTLYIKESGTGNTGWVASGAGGGAPTDATYVTQTANGTLSAEQALSALSSGIMRVATTTGVVTSLTDSSGIATNISDETGSGALVFGTSPTIGTPTITGAITFPDGVRQTFNPDGTNAGLNVGSQAGDPSTPSNGDLWYDSTANELTARINGADVSLGAGGTPTAALGSATIIEKASDESVSTSTTLQDDDDFTFTAAVNTDYEIEIVAFVTGDDVTGDIKWAWTVPAGATGWHSATRQDVGATSTASNVNVTATETLANSLTAGLVDPGTPTMVLIKAFVSVAGTGGAVTWQWAQDSSDADNTTVQSSSYMVVREVGFGVDDVNASDTDANRPAASAAGLMFWPTNSFYFWRDNGSSWVPWGPVYPMTEPVDGDFSWVNQGGASVSTTNGGIYLEAPASGTTNIRARIQSAPATPYTITAAVLVTTSDAITSGGLLFRENSSGALALWGLTHNRDLRSLKYTNATTFSANYTITEPHFDGGVLWIRIADDGVDRILSWSMDGQNFIAIHTVTRTDFLTADEVGFFINNESSAQAAGITLLSWVEG